MAEVYSYNPDTSGSHPYSQPPVDARSIQSMSDAIAASPTAVQLQPDGTLAPINHRRVYETDTERPHHIFKHLKK